MMLPVDVPENSETFCSTCASRLCSNIAVISPRTPPPSQDRIMKLGFAMVPPPFHLTALPRPVTGRADHRCDDRFAQLSAVLGCRQPACGNVSYVSVLAIVFSLGRRGPI